MLLPWRFGPGQLRFLLAALVVVSHLTSLNVGRPAVMLFFMLSGYWVSRLHSGWRTGNATFVASRMLRIWPLYAIVTLLAWLCLRMAGVPSGGDLLSALPLIGLAARPGDVLGVSWSLDIELQFYLMMPLIAVLAQRLSAVQALIAALAGFGAGIWLFAHQLPTMLFYLPAFLIGVLIHRRQWQPGAALVCASLIASLAAGALFAVLPEWNGLIFKARFTDSTAENLAHLGWMLLLAPLVAWNVVQPSDHVDRWFGDLSYTLYLVHLPVVTLVALVIPMAGAGSKLIALLAIALVSLAVFTGVDRGLEMRRARLWRS